MIEATFGSGNVFADLGLDNPEVCQRKADLVGWMQDLIDERDLPVGDAADLIGLSRADLDKLLRGRTGDYTVADLGGFLAALTHGED